MADTFKIKDAPMLGYLNKDFELFYICEESLPDFSYHYHDFYKLLIHMQGDVSYHIEGKEYALQPGDTLLISPGEIHKAELKKACCYERIIAYISEEFFKHEEAFNVDLKQCFVLASDNKSHVARFTKSSGSLSQIVRVLKSCFFSKDFGSELLKKVKLEEYMIILNRLLLSDNDKFISATSNPKVIEALDYINNNLNKELSIESIASSLYVNPSYLMHLFKDETGYTIGRYISEKRLFLASQYIANGKTMTEACYLSGYQNSGTFYYAYKKRYGVSPKNH